MLPPANNPSIPLNEQWDEMKMHNSPSGRLLYEDIMRPISYSEINHVIKNVKRKAPGHDDLYIDTFKHLGPAGKTLLRCIYDEIYTSGAFPDTWKKAILAPILKKEKPPRDPASYRPISLLPVGGKILECIIL